MLKTLLSATALLLAAASAQAATVDQSYLPTGPSSALTIDGNTTSRAQTFTVGQGGALTGVRLSLSDKGNFDNALSATLTIGIFDVSGGSIDIAGGAFLSQTIGRVLGSTSFNDFKLFETSFASSLPVAVGDTLAIVLSGVNAGQNDGFYWEAGGDAAGYANGTRWQTFTAGGALTEVPSGSDHQFATLVDTSPVAPPPGVIPLPASLPLLLAGLGAFGLLRRRRG